MNEQKKSWEEISKDFENDFADYSESELYLVFDDIEDWWFKKTKSLLSSEMNKLKEERKNILETVFHTALTSVCKECKGKNLLCKGCGGTGRPANSDVALDIKASILALLEGKKME